MTSWRQKKKRLCGKQTDQLLLEDYKKEWTKEGQKWILKP